jgi:hypothetical protein
MIVGFNHNINYRGVGFHVQTEDSGVKKPQLVTLLYHGGTIVSSQKTVYSDILKVDNLEQVVEELAKEQHKGMLRRLTKGEFDQRIIDLGIPIGPATAENQPGQQPIAAGAKVLKQPAPPAPSASAPETDKTESIAAPPPPTTVPPSIETEMIVEEPIIDKFRKPKPTKEQSLDDLIFAYLTGADS